MSRLTAFLLSLLLLLSLPVTAADKLERLLVLFDFDNYQASFQQKTLDAEGKALQELEGKLLLQRPDKFHWQSGEPFPQQIISDGKTIWHYDEDLEQLVVQQYAEQVDSTPLLLILNDTNNITERFELVNYTKKRQTEQFSLRLKQADQNIKQVDMHFEKGVLARLRFVDNLQQVTDIALDDRKTNQVIDAANFHFDIPEGADILYE